MNRKNLQERFFILGDNSSISLYRKQEGHNTGYCGTISLANGKAKFNGKSYGDLESLDSALKEWEASLEWPVHTYDPLVVDTYKLEARLVWWLTEKMHFTHTVSRDWNDFGKYSRTIGPSFSISFSVNRKEENKVEIYSKYAGLSFIQTVDDENDGIAVMSEVIRSSVLMMAKDMVSILSDCPETENAEIRTFIKSNRNIFGYEEVDFKTVMISELEKQLKKLKGTI